MKTFFVIFFGIAAALILIGFISLEQENQALKTDNAALHAEIDGLQAENDALQVEVEFLRGSTEPSGNVYLGDTSRDTGYALKVGDKLPSPDIITGGYQRRDSYHSVDGRVEASVVVTLSPGVSYSSGQYTYSSPHGATIHLDTNNRITNINGTVHRR